MSNESAQTIIENNHCIYQTAKFLEKLSHAKLLNEKNIKLSFEMIALSSSHYIEQILGIADNAKPFNQSVFEEMIKDFQQYLKKLVSEGLTETQLSYPLLNIISGYAGYPDKLFSRSSSQQPNSEEVKANASPISNGVPPFEKGRLG